MTNQELSRQVAEKMRWKKLTGHNEGLYQKPDGAIVTPRFTESWRLTGPLIEKYGIGIIPHTEGGETFWTAHIFPKGERGNGDTPLIAACRALIAMD